ncbi:MAG TPA: hypothetical protein VFZ23_15460 [Pyrinomonadaceae bacterium]
MRAFAIAVVLISGAILYATPAVNVTPPLFQTFCVDGDGLLTDWVTSRYEAYLIGREHERNNRGHRWEILVHEGDSPVMRIPACARLSEGSKANTLKLENLCDKCIKFTVSRTAADGNVKSREISIQPKKSRHFRNLPGTTVNVEGEQDCSE